MQQDESGPSLIGLIATSVWQERRTVIVATLTAALALAVVLASGMHLKRYTSDSFILLAPTSGFDPARPGRQVALALDPFTIRAETEVIQSATISRTVIEQLKLTESAAYTRPTVLGHVLGRALCWARDNVLGPQNRPEESLADRVDRAVAEYQTHLTVINDGRSPAVHIRFSALTPELAAAIANRHASVYIAEQLRERADRGRELVAALEAELRGRARDLASSQAELEEYQRKLVLTRPDVASTEGELRALELVATSKRDAYSAVLAALNAARADQSLNLPNARIVSPALPNAAKISSMTAIALGISIVSVILGACAGVLRDLSRWRPNRSRRESAEGPAAGTQTQVVRAGGTIQAGPILSRLQEYRDRSARC